MYRSDRTDDDCQRLSNEAGVAPWTESDASSTRRSRSRSSGASAGSGRRSAAGCTAGHAPPSARSPGGRSSSQGRHRASAWPPPGRSPRSGRGSSWSGASEERLTRAPRRARCVVHGEDRFPIVVADMGSLASVRAAVDRILATEPRLDVVIDNAGAIYPERTRGPRRHRGDVRAAGRRAVRARSTGLLPLLRRTPAVARHRRDVGRHVHAAPRPRRPRVATGRYAGARAYARAKRAQVALDARVGRAGSPDRGVAFAAMHPGWADTPGLADSAAGVLPGDAAAAAHRPRKGPTRSSGWRRTPDPAATSGRLFLDRRPRPFDRVPATRLSAARARAPVGPRRGAGDGLTRRSEARRLRRRRDRGSSRPIRRRPIDGGGRRVDDAVREHDDPRSGRPGVRRPRRRRATIATDRLEQRLDDGGRRRLGRRRSRRR